MEAQRNRCLQWNLLLTGVLALALGCQKSPSDTSTSGPPSRLLSALAPSRHYVEVTLEAPVPEEALSPSRFTILSPQDTPLPIKEVRRDGAPGRLLLVTEPQAPVLYRLSATGSSAPATPFPGSTGNEPALHTAVSLDSSTVLLTFSARLEKTSAEHAAFYRIVALDAGAPRHDVGGIDILSATLSEDATSVVLRTTPQADLEYTVIVTNVRGKSGNAPINPAKNTAVFYGNPPIDIVTPRLVSAVSIGRTSVLLSFSEPLHDSAADPTYFTISPSLVVLAAELSRFGTQIVLTTLPQVEGQVSTVTVNAHVKDRAGNALEPTAHSATFTFSPSQSPTPGADDEPLRLASALSTGNMTVVVQFSHPMSDSATNPSNYAIVQENVNPEVGALAIKSALFLLATDGTVDRTSVLLTTASQNEVTYTLIGGNVRDLGGRPLGPRRIVAGTVVDPRLVSFPGTPPTGPEQLTDSDGDGLSDAEEQRGWLVTVTLADGQQAVREVTGAIDSADSDGDGLSDAGEKALSTNPRDADTDDDLLADAQEVRELRSSPTRQDTDADGLADGTEYHLFRTSPLLADTDGDQLSDGQEVQFANRNPRVADLPLPTLAVGETALQLDVRFTEETAKGRRLLQSKTVASSLVQTERKEISDRNSNTQEAFAKLGVSHQWKVEAEFPAGSEVSEVTTLSVEKSWSGSWTSEHTENSSKETQQGYQKSLQTDVDVSETATVHREVQGAAMRSVVFLRHTGSLAYTVRNLQLAVLIQDPQDPTRFTPIATLLPDAEPESGFALGPLVPERGPILFSNETIFPLLVESLMRNPRGVVFRFSNFDITDELGRNFAFTSQDILDRTATLVIDSGSFDADGDGRGELTEYHRVATGTGRRVDTNGDGQVDAADRRVTFDAEGRPLGSTLRDALSSIGLTHYDESVTPSSSLTENELKHSYSTRRMPDGREWIYRIRQTAIDEHQPQLWEILTPQGVDRTRSLDSFLLTPGGDIKLAYIVDLDQDRMISTLERMNNCSDTLKDTDGDGVDDRYEVLVGWKVTVADRGTRSVFSTCSLQDSDGDGLSDAEEAPGRRVDTNGDGVLEALEREGPDDFVTDPTSSDTDGDGISDFDEVRGYTITLRSGQVITVRTDPTHPDTDGDTAPDGIERRYGGNPTDPSDRDSFSDDDGDGLINIVELEGWSISVRAVSTSPSRCHTVCDEGVLSTPTVTSNPALADTDGDGLLDGEEYVLGTHPRQADTDGDGLLDRQEALGFQLRDLGVIILDPRDADTDNDKRSDGAEVELDTPETHQWIVRATGKQPYRVFSDPLRADQDHDTLADGDEYDAGTDPTLGNTDEDLRTDAEEVRRGTRPLTPDFLVTVSFRDIFVEDDCESGAGDYHFHLGAILPDGSTGYAIKSIDQVLLPLPWCDDLDDNLCRRSDFPKEIQIKTGSTLPLGRLIWNDPVVRQDPSVTFGVATNEAFWVWGVVEEEDPDEENGTWPFYIGDPFADPSGFFAGDELAPGVTPFVFKKTDDCEMQIRAYVTVH